MPFRVTCSNWGRISHRFPSWWRICLQEVDTAVMENLLVSVILPVYNGERLLAESIACVLRQTYHPVE